MIVYIWVWPGSRNDSEKWETELNIKELKYCDSRDTFVTALWWQVEETGEIVPHISSITIWYNDAIWYNDSIIQCTIG